MTGKLKLITAMLIFGSIGLFVKKIQLSSSEIAFLRGVIGSIFLLLASFFVGKKPSLPSIKENWLLLLFSGGAIGFNWILLFQAYKYTTIAKATLSYYFAPLFFVVLAHFFLKERVTLVKLGCITTAILGLFLVINVGNTGTSGAYAHVTGILYGLSAAVLYASVIVMNKFIKNLSGFETTLVQLLLAALVLLPYVGFTEQMNFSGLDTNSIISMLILGVLHTGVAYFLYFTSLKELKGHTIAITSYIDPISAVILSALVLGEHMNFMQMLGAALILGSTFLSEKLEAPAKKHPSSA